MSAVAGLVLAAGAGSRLGTPKALVLLDGLPLPVRAARLLRAGGCGPVAVVLGARADAARALLASHGEADVVAAPGWEKGLSVSLRTGLGHLPADVGAVVLALADQPLLTPALVARLVAAWQEGAVAVQASYQGRRRNPVLLDRSAWTEVLALAQGDSGARAWLRAHADRVRAVECADLGSDLDIDTAEDLERAHTLAGGAARTGDGGSPPASIGGEP